MSTDDETDTSWVRPGAEVVVWQDTFHGVPNPATTTVTKVAGKSFTIDGHDQRFNLTTLSTKQQGTRMTGSRYRVVPADSEKARELYDAERRHVAMARARTAVDVWQRTRTRDNRLAAIEALQAVED